MGKRSKERAKVRRYIKKQMIKTLCKIGCPRIAASVWVLGEPNIVHLLDLYSAALACQSSDGPGERMVLTEAYRNLVNLDDKDSQSS